MSSTARREEGRERRIGQVRAGVTANSGIDLSSIVDRARRFTFVVGRPLTVDVDCNRGERVAGRCERGSSRCGVRGSAEKVEKVLFSHESRILTPGGGAISPGGAGPPASPSPGHYRPPTHSPPLVKVSLPASCFDRYRQATFALAARPHRFADRHDARRTRAEREAEKSRRERERENSPRAQRKKDLRVTLCKK